MDAEKNTSDVTGKIARIINATLEPLPPRVAVALWYQTGQPEPALYLCHETLENCMKGLLKETEPTAVTATIERLTSTRDSAIAENRPDWLQMEVLRRQLGPLLDPGNWSNPADPVIIDRDSEPEIYAWARLAFDAIEARYKLPEPDQTAAFYKAEQHIRDVLWAALDEARRTFKGRWPPISFVLDGDDYMETALERIVGRGVPFRDQR